MSVNAYFQQVKHAFEEYDGDTASRLLSFQDPHIANHRLQMEYPEKLIERWFEPPMDELVAGHLRACWAIGNADFIEAHKCQSFVTTAFTKIFQNQKDENWGLPIMFAVTLDLRLFATNADKQNIKIGHYQSGGALEKAAENLMACFRICASDNRAAPDDSKKWGMLYLVNQLFKIYFKINKLHLCKPLIRAIDALPMKDKFSLSQMVTYRYYVGRKAMFEGDFKSADEYLSFAFSKCHRKSKSNKRLILIYLLPVKMLLGYKPKAGLLQKYELPEFVSIVEGVSSGNLLLFNKTLRKHEDFFIRCGVYLILEKLKIITYRNLFKKVHILLNTHQLPIGAFTAALRMMKVDDIDDDEVECLLANLIYENKIKGYIANQHKKLVVSKANPFPSLIAAA